MLKAEVDLARQLVKEGRLVYALCDCPACEKFHAAATALIDAGLAVKKRRKKTDRHNDGSWATDAVVYTYRPTHKLKQLFQKEVNK